METRAKALGEKPCQSCYGYLEKQGVETSRLTATDGGAKQPGGRQQTAAGRTLNRAWRLNSRRGKRIFDSMASDGMQHIRRSSFVRPLKDRSRPMRLNAHYYCTKYTLSVALLVASDDGGNGARFERIGPYGAMCDRC